MALFSDDEDYQDDQGQNQQPLNTLDHIDSSRNLYNNIKNKQGSSAAGSAGSQAAAKGSATDASGKATTAAQGTAQEAGKKTVETAGGTAEKSSLAAGASSGNAATAAASAASIPILIIIAIVIGIILLIFFLIGVLADLTSFSTFDTATSYIDESKKKGIDDIKSFLGKFSQLFDNTEWIEADENEYDPEFDFKVYLRAAGIEDSCLSEPVYASLTDNTSSYSEQDIYLLAQTVWHEARGEGMNGWIAVAEVILNRVNSTAYPDTISEVIYQGSDGGKEQFQNSSEISSCTPSAAAVAVTRMVAWGRTSILNDPDVLYFRNPGDISDNSDWGNCPFYTRIGNHAFYLAQGAARPTIEKKEVPLTSGTTETEVPQPPKEDSYQPALAESSIIKSEGDIPAERIRNIEANYEKIPENVRKCLIDSGWSYICTDSDFGRQNGINGSILALTVWNTKTIYIDNRKAAESAIIHETGHAVDSLNRGCSFSAEFFSIYQTERDAFCSIWNTHHSNTDTSVEYFAECFSAYVQNPSLLSEHCPATFAYIDNLVKIM